MSHWIKSPSPPKGSKQPHSLQKYAFKAASDDFHRATRCIEFFDSVKGANDSSIDAVADNDDDDDDDDDDEDNDEDDEDDGKRVADARPVLSLTGADDFDICFVFSSLFSLVYLFSSLFSLLVLFVWHLLVSRVKCRL